MEIINQFRCAMANDGLIYNSDIIADGVLHRLAMDSDKGKRNGWYVFHSDGVPSGAYGCWKRNISKSWCSKRKEEMSEPEWQQHLSRIEKAKKKQAELKANACEAAREKAQTIWDSAISASSNHPYLTRKGIKEGSLRITKENKLIVPIHNANETIHSLQFINADGEKRFLTDGAIRGNFHQIGSITNDIYICEGYATGATLHEVTNCCVIVAFNCNNLPWVTKAIKHKYANHNIIIAADNDSHTENNPGLNKAKEAAGNIGAKIIYPDFSNISTDSKPTDWNDLANLAGIEEIKQQILSFNIQKDDGNIEAEQPKKSQATALVDFTMKHVKLFHDKNSYTYSQNLTTGETKRLNSRQFKNWLIANFYESTKRSPSEKAIQEAINTLGGLAIHKGELREVHIRVAQYDGRYYLDLGEPNQNRVICISSKGWEVISNPPVYFLRPETLQPLPEPQINVDISLLWDMVNVSEHDRLLIITWLIDCLRPETPFPVLELIGEQGSAKSTTQAMLRRLIDPNSCDLRAAPKTQEDIFVSAGVNWLVSYENISHLSPQTQDALCVLATGGGFAKRKLYSDADESVIQVKRPVVLNGISAAITAQDLLDRTVSIEVPLITNRTEITELLNKYKLHQPALLGALLNIFSESLARLNNIELQQANRPRLAEFARLGMAVAETMGKDGNEFLSQFNASRQEAIARTIDASPVASALIEWFDSVCRRKQVLPVKQLFLAVESKKPINTDSWPRSPKGFADALRRIAPALRTLGIDCHCLGKIGSYVSWSVEAIG